MIKSFLPLVFFTLASTAGMAQNDLQADLDKLDLFLRSIDERYVDSVETGAIVEKGMRSMLESLDPHSIYMNANQYKRASEPLAGKFKGIGIRYHVLDDTLTVTEVIPNSPAAEGMLQRGDQLLAIGTDTLSGKSLRSGQMSKLLKDPENADRPVVIKRPENPEPIFKVLNRANVRVSSVPAYFMIDNRVGYIKLSRFSATSASDFRKAMDDLKRQKMKSLIFDLRGNSGGYLNIAIKIVDEFLEDRKLIVYTEGTHQAKKETFATSGGRFTKGDLVILIDENSASASEIVAGAIQDWDRGLIIGRRSFGKGLVQRTVEFSDGSAMRLTISRYYTPTGRSIQKPYDEDLDEYKSELKHRKASGELYSSDSIKVNDSLIFYTPAHRRVYGGGGIIPDVFVASDTTKMSDYYRELSRKGIAHLYALKYTREHEAHLRRMYADVGSFKDEFVVTDAMLDAIKQMGARRGVAIPDEDHESATTHVQLVRAMRVLIARFTYGFDQQYIVLAESDASIQRALEALESNTLSELGLK